MTTRRITTKKDGVSQTVNIHIHEKSEKNKRRRRRKKVSTSGAIRTLNRFVPQTSSFSQGIIPQRRFSQQQLVALPEGDKALGQTGMLGYNVPQPHQLTYQKELMKLAIKEYEKEVEGRSLKARDKPVETMADREIESVESDLARLDAFLKKPKETAKKRPLIIELKTKKTVKDETRQKLISLVFTNDEKLGNPDRGITLYNKSEDQLRNIVNEQERKIFNAKPSSPPESPVSSPPKMVRVGGMNLFR